MAYTLVPTELIVDGAITSAKLDTNIAISGTLGVTGEVTLATHLIMGDNDKIKIGTGGDLEIYHDGSNSYISNSTGNLYLGDTNGAVHIQAKLNEESIICAADGAVTLYHDNSPKLATTSTGIDVTGTATMDGLTVDGTGSFTQSSNAATALTTFTNSNAGASARASISFASDTGSSVVGTVSSGWTVDALNANETFMYGSNGVSLFAPASQNVRILAGGSERMRIDSGGRVMIAETSNSGYSANADDLIVGNNGSATERGISIGSTAGGGIRWNDGADAGIIQYVHSSNAMQFYTANSLAATIDSSGNVGIGCTPSAQLQVGSGTDALTGTGTGQICLSGAGQTLAVTSKPAVYHRNGVGLGLYSDFSMSFEINGSTSKTEAMRIDSSGNVGIGSDSISGISANATTLDIRGGVTTKGGAIRLRSSDSSVSTYLYADNTSGLSINTSTSHPIVFRTAGAEKMRIDAIGDLTVGTSSLGFHFDVSTQLFSTTFGTGGNLTLACSNSSGTGTGGEIFLGGSTRGDALRNCIIFKNGSSAERMRIDASGNLLVGTTSSSQTSGAGVKLIDDGTNGRVWVQGASQTSGEGFSLHANGSYRFYVAYGGAIASTSTSITAISDERLKENIVDLETGLSEVMSLKPRRFDWKENEGSNEKNVAGFIAQEVETVLPDLVGDFKHEELEDVKSVKMGDMIPTLVKAIQEQQTIIDDLKSRIETLEG